MNFDEIETFLSVVQHTTIAHAANELFIGQGTASSRIQHMEQELGIPLFFRQKGIRNVTLTPEGEHFLSIAQQLISLMQQAKQIKNSMVFRELRIAAVDTMNQFHFADVYRNFIERNKNVQLYLQTEHSTEIHQLIENQQADIGFVFSLHKSPNVVAKPLYTEKNVILYHRDSKFGRTKELEDLKPENEIYLTFGNDYDMWHKRQFPAFEMRRVSIGTFSMLPFFIDAPNTWTILPQSLAEVMKKKSSGLSYQIITDNPPPTRTSYILQYKYPKPWVQELGRLFLKEVLTMIRANPALCLLYPNSGEFPI